MIVNMIPLILISCAGKPESENQNFIQKEESSSTGRVPDEIIEILHLYEESIRTGNHDLFRENLTEDAQLRFTERMGNRNDIQGMDAIAEFRLYFFSDFGPQSEFQLGEIADIEGNGINHFALSFSFPDSFGAEWIHLRKENNQWKIFGIDVLLHQPGEWVTNHYQALTDYDRNGFLNGDEFHELEQFTHHFYSGPHEVSNQLDDFFDINKDGYIDLDEIRRGADIHFVLGPKFWKELFPGADRQLDLLDLNGDNIISDEELYSIRDFMSGGPEIPVDRERLLHLTLFAIYPDAVYLPVPREISSILDEMADRDSDRIIDEQEHNIIIESLLPAEKEAHNYLEKAIDRNHDGWVNGGDVFLILQDSALGRGMVSEEMEPPYEVITPIDKMLDRNNDDQVDADEIESVVYLLSGDIDLMSQVSETLQEILDMNRDGHIEIQEIEETKGIIFYPRQIDPDNDLERELDNNNDDFIDPGELGIAAGITSKGEIPPFEERISIIRRRGGDELPLDDHGTTANTSTESITESGPNPGSDYYRKLGIIQDKKLAVIALDIGTDKIDKETSNGIIVFVENAFVNVGKVKVVDRSHIKEIFDEMKFQASSAIDESTAVEIGKLSGADIIVMGSVNRVGGLFYLNIKLITVQTAEIIGSSISQASDATGFLEMANQAVYMLF